MPRRSNPFVASLFLANCIFVVTPTANAIDKFWSNNRGDGSGTFSSATNWSPSVPGVNDVAHFGMTTSSLDPKTYTVSFTALAESQHLVVEDDRVTFDLNGNIFRTSSQSGNAIGTVPGRSARLTILDGAWDHDPILGGILDVGDNAPGTFIVSTGASFYNQRVFVGSGFTGTLVVQNGGAIVNSAFVFIGASHPGTGTVTGTNSRLSVKGLNVGDKSDGTLTVNSGGLLENSGIAVLGNSGVGSTMGVGTVNIDGANSSWTNSGDLDVGRFGAGIVNITGGAHATLASVDIGPVETAVNGLDAGSGKVTVSGANSQLSGNTLTIGGRMDGTGNGELNVLDGGLMKSPGLTIGKGGAGALNITAGGRIETFNSSLSLSGGPGVATVSGVGSQWINTASLGVGPSGTLTISDGGFVQNFDCELGAPTGGLGGSLVTVTGANSEWKNLGPLTVSRTRMATVNISAGGVVRSASGVVGSSLFGSDGAVNVDGFTSKWVNSADIRIGISGNGAVMVTNGGAVEAQNVTVESHGSLGGNGTIIGNVENGGIVAPGASIGTLEINGAFTQQPGGVLEIEIGGSSSSHVDLLNVGAATLDGELRLKLIAGTVPTVNVALSAVSLAGQFDNAANGQRLTTVDGFGSFVVNYGAGSPFDPTQVVLSSFLASVPGDYNNNGVVDAADYVLWRNGGPLANEVDMPGTVNAADYAAWRARFGNTSGSGAATLNSPTFALASATLPEPQAIVLLFIGVAAGWPRHDKLHRRS